MTLAVQNWKEAGWRRDVVELRHLSSGCHSLPPAGKSLPLLETHFHFYTSCIYSLKVYYLFLSLASPLLPYQMMGPLWWPQFLHVRCPRGARLKFTANNLVGY
jgi:hypothetical protein